jgi:protease-4
VFSESSYASELLTSLLKEGVGIKAFSMGQAYTAIATGPESVFYNPAGLALSGMGLEYEKTDFKNPAFTRADNYVLYFNPVAFSYRAKTNNQGDFGEVYTYTFGYKGNNGISWGANLKTVRTTGNGATQGWSTDLGLLMNLTKNINLGAMVQDFPFDRLTGLTTSIRTGAAYFTDDKRLSLAADLLINPNQMLDTSLGASYTITDSLILRTGLYKSRLTGGFTLNFGIIDINAAFVTNANVDPTYLIGVQISNENFLNQPNKITFFKERSFAEINISGDLVDGKSDSSFFGGNKLGSNDLLTYIHRARKNPNCQGFLLHIGDIGSGLTTLALVQEIREELRKAKDQGLIIVAYLEDWSGLPEYYLATVANKIVMPKLGVISHLGLDVEINKMKGFLEKFGIEHKIINSGKYKAILNQYSDKLTEDEKFEIKDLVQNLYSQVIADIQGARNLAFKNLGTTFDGRIIDCDTAVSLNMVDDVGYWDQVKETAKKLNSNRDFKIMPLQSFLAENNTATFLSPFNKIAVIEVDGFIKKGDNSKNPYYGGKDTGADEMDRLIESIKGDFTIRGVILRVNSPGGNIIAADKIYQAIAKLKKAGKKVYTSMGDIATSGGYYIALNSDKIYANSTTITGSIGVISIFQNYEDLYKLLGIETDVIKTGKFMDTFSPNKKMTKEEELMVRSFQQKQYEYFCNLVSENRKLEPKKLEVVAQGQAFTGDQALKLKLIDKLGSFYDAVADLSSELNISYEPLLIFYRN